MTVAQWLTACLFFGGIAFVFWGMAFAADVAEAWFPEADDDN